MKKSIAYSIFLFLALMALRFAQRSLAAGPPLQVRHTVIAESGAAAPAGGTYSPFFLNTTLNARHDVAFDALLIGPTVTTGVFMGDGKTTSVIALGTNPDPAAPSFGSVSNPFMTPNDVVVFDVNNTDILRSDGKTIVSLVRDGDPAPGGGTVSPDLGTSRGVNDHGVIAYVAGVNGSTATQGIFLTDGTQTVAIARDDIAPPTGGSFTAFFAPAVNDRGQVVFKSEMSGGTADHGIFRGEGGRLTPIFVTNQLAPGGVIIQDCGTPAINAHGQVMAPCLVNNASSSGVFVGDGASVVSIALQGQTAPTGGTYFRFVGTTRLNDQGEVAFGALFQGGATGLFRHTGEQTTTIAFTGMSAPGTTGTFQSFGDDIRFRNDGRVAFVGRLTTGVGGVDASNNVGIWVGTSAQDLQLVVRTGDVIGGKVLTSLPFRAAFGQQFGMNENGVVWVGGFRSGARAVVLSRD